MATEANKRKARNFVAQLQVEQNLVPFVLLLAKIAGFLLNRYIKED